MIKEQKKNRFRFSSRTRKRRNNGKPWSKYDLRKLKELYSHNHDFQLARMLGRTPEAVRTQGTRLGMQKKYDDEFKPFRSESRPRWTDEDIRILKKMYLTHTFEEISDVIGHTTCAISKRAQELKLRKLKFWTKEEDDYLRRHFAHKSSHELGQKFARTPEAVLARAAALGLKRKFDWWAERELNLLIRHYPTMQTRELAKLIGRTPSQIIAKAFVLKIQKDKQCFVADGRRFSKKEIEEIYRLYKDHPAREVAKILGYPYKPVRHLLNRHSPGKQKFWTKKEDTIIRKFYKKMTYTELAEKLGRTAKTVGCRIERLGLIKRAMWNNDEEQILIKEYKKGTPVKKIAEMVNKSGIACLNKIQRLKLRRILIKRRGFRGR